MFLLKPPPVFGEGTTKSTAQTSNANQWGIPHLISLPWLSVAAIFCCICMAAPIVHLVPLGTDLGLDLQTATSVLLVLMAADVRGRNFFGVLADRKGSLFAYIIASLGQTVVVFWFTQTASLPLLYVFAVLFGFFFS
jgi:predicted MFS family arabinose efflux permease